MSGAVTMTASETVVKVFTATMQRDRERLGEDATNWLRTHPDLEVLERVVTQSSDSEYHCLSITLFCWVPPGS